jgi:hypothetical protein
MTYRDFPSASAVSAMYVRLIGEHIRPIADLERTDMQSNWGIKMHLRLDWGRAERSGSGAQRGGARSAAPGGP